MQKGGGQSPRPTSRGEGFATQLEASGLGSPGGWGPLRPACATAPRARRPVHPGEGRGMDHGDGFLGTIGSSPSTNSGARLNHVTRPVGVGE